VPGAPATRSGIGGSASGERDDPFPANVKAAGAARDVAGELATALKADAGIPGLNVRQNGESGFDLDWTDKSGKRQSVKLKSSPNGETEIESASDSGSTKEKYKTAADAAKSLRDRYGKA